MESEPTTETNRLATVEEALAEMQARDERTQQKLDLLLSRLAPTEQNAPEPVNYTPVPLPLLCMWWSAAEPHIHYSSWGSYSTLPISL